MVSLELAAPMEELTSAPSTEAVDALLRAIAPGSTVRDIRPLRGSFSNSTHLVEIDSPRGPGARIAVRRYAVCAGYDRGEKARREYKTLELLAAHDIPAPRPLYLDDAGEYLGMPAIVTSFVPGCHITAPADPVAWARGLAAMLARIHAIPCGAKERDFLLDANSEAAWFLHSGNVPERMQAHADGRDIWHSVRTLLPAIQCVPPTLVHIDYYSGNILWEDDQITAVLDWEEAACGDPAIDVAYLRMELFTWGMSNIAEEFLQFYAAEAGRPVENLGIWELAAAARNMPDPAVHLPELKSISRTDCTGSSVRQGFAAFITDARARAGL
jgi:aminoglycoside phosphotransferase (APT) family kinase protein